MTKPGAGIACASAPLHQGEELQRRGPFMVIKLWFVLTLFRPPPGHELRSHARKFCQSYSMMQLSGCARSRRTILTSPGSEVPSSSARLSRSSALTFLLRKDEWSFPLAAAAAACLAIAFFGIWIFVTNVANAEIAGWSAQSIPADWSAWRRQWDYSHAARFVLHFVGFTALVGAAFASSAVAQRAEAGWQGNSSYWVALILVQ